LRRRLGKHLPRPEEVLAKPWAAPFRRWLGHPNLWHLNRRSVPGAVAIGLFCGLIPGPVQMLGALLFAIPCRSNVPLAMAITLYTNPLTIVPLYLVAYEYGRLLLGHGALAALPALPEWEWSLHAIWHWTLSLGKPLAVGLVALAVTLALVGYVVAALGWRWYVVSAWRRRAARAGRPAARGSAPRGPQDRRRGSR
jgi:uncharacterized protein (DUF2062 family)